MLITGKDHLLFSILFGVSKAMISGGRCPGYDRNVVTMAKDLLSELKQGSESAYKQLFYGYFTDLVYYANHFLKNRELAEDLVQELFIAFWYEKKYLSIQSGLEGYLYRSVRNSCLNQLRDDKRKNDKLSLLEPQAMSEQSFMWNESEAAKDELFCTFHRLPEQCKTVFTLCCMEGLKYQEAAEQLGLSIGTIRTQMGRAFKFLRNALDGKDFSSFLFFYVVKKFIQRAVR